MSEQVKGIIFDMDGTLVSSALDFSAMRAAIGCPAEQDILAFIDALPDAQSRSLAEQTIMDMEIREANDCELLTGVSEALQILREWQLPLAVVTRNCLAATQVKLSKINLQFDPVLTRECAPAKPHPGALLQVAKRWQCSPDHLVYVGDYLHDVNAANNAANNAGMRSALMTFNNPPSWQHNATWQCNDYFQFLEIVASHRG